MDAMYFAWLGLEHFIDMDENLQLPQFTLVTTFPRDCSTNYTSGEYTCHEINFVLRRNIGYILIQFYIPSILIVILSWVSFWINVDASSARAILGLFPVLTTIWMSGVARDSQPKFSYIKSIDIWMLTCLVFAFASLIEYAIVNALARRPPKTVRRAPLFSSYSLNRLYRLQGRSADAVQLESASSTTQKSAPSPSLSQQITHEGGTSEFHEIDGKTRARNVDKLSRKIFPLVFLVFNLVYWISNARF